MTTRDKVIIAVVAGFVAIAAYWFLLLSPQRKKADDLGKQVTAQRQKLQQAQADANASRAARASYAGDYATVARIGKAVPVDDDVPSLVYELQSASSQTGVDFRAIKVTGASSGASPTSSTPPASGSGGSNSSSKPSSAEQARSGTSTTPSGQAPANGSSTGTPPSNGTSSGSTPSSSPPSSGAPSSSASSAPPTGGSPSSPSAPASQTAAAGLPPGATVGPAGLITMPFSFTFEGNFFHLSDFFQKLDRFIRSSPSKLQVNGRLLTIDGVALSAVNDLHHIKAEIAATAYLLPDTQGLLGGATPSGPAPSTSGTGTAPTTSGGSATPAPTAAAAAPVP